MTNKLTFNGEEYEEITGLEADETNYKDCFRVQNIENRAIHYFKKVQKFPVVFEAKNRKFQVYKDGDITLFDKSAKEDIFLSGSLPELYQAVELSKKLREGRKE